MANPEQSAPIVDEKIENPRMLGLAGGLLFGLGMIAVFLAYIQDDQAAKISMVLNAAVLLSLGYPALLYVRALNKIMLLEQRLRALEDRARS